MADNAGAAAGHIDVGGDSPAPTRAAVALAAGGAVSEVGAGPLAEYHAGADAHEVAPPP